MTFFHLHYILPVHYTTFSRLDCFYELFIVIFGQIFTFFHLLIYFMNSLRSCYVMLRVKMWVWFIWIFYPRWKSCSSIAWWKKSQPYRNKFWLVPWMYTKQLQQQICCTRRDCNSLPLSTKISLSNLMKSFVGGSKDIL